MEDAINFAIWLNYNTSKMYGAYILKGDEYIKLDKIIAHGDLFYIDSKTDMELLYNLSINIIHE